jgi:hypothetical protein
MKKLLCLMMLLAAVAAAQPRPEWDDLAVIQAGVERPHASMMVYPSAALARGGEMAKSPLVPVFEWKLEVPLFAQPRSKARRVLSCGFR